MANSGVHGELRERASCEVRASEAAAGVHGELRGAGPRGPGVQYLPSAARLPARAAGTCTRTCLRGPAPPRRPPPRPPPAPPRRATGPAPAAPARPRPPRFPRAGDARRRAAPSAPARAAIPRAAAPAEHRPPRAAPPRRSGRAWRWPGSWKPSERRRELRDRADTCGAARWWPGHAAAGFGFPAAQELPRQEAGIRSSREAERPTLELGEGKTAPRHCPVVFPEI